MSQQQPRRRAITPGVAVSIVCAVLVAALAVAGAVWWRPALRATHLWIDGGAPTVAPTFFEDPSASPTPSTGSTADAGSGVIGTVAELPAGKDPSPAALAKAIAAVPARSAGTTSGVVLDATTGTALYDKAAATPLLPASTMKLLTCTAALEALGPDTRFTTKVVLTAPGHVVLVGGGDPYLSSAPAKAYPWAASSQQLAAQAAAALKVKGVRSVTLGYDDSLFTGPAWHPSWPAGYHDQVTTLSSLWIDKGKPDAKHAATTTPATTAATLFAAQLKAAGITVTGKQAAARVKTTDTQLAAVQSLPVRTLVSETLLHSDNSAAEVLLRQVGVATGNGGSFAGGTKGVQQVLTRLGDWSAKARMVDGSGLSRNNAIPAAMLTGVLHDAATTPKLSSLLESLPSAGVTGTLYDRFYTPASAPGRGWVNAKTGTLSEVSTLAGFTRTRSGAVVVFAFMSNKPTQQWDVRSWLDQVAAAVASS